MGGAVITSVLQEDRSKAIGDRAVDRKEKIINGTYRRDSPFSYTCHACSRCCHDKIIQLNPYEVARLAQNRGGTTTEFLARYTERNGTALRRTEEGACVFLTPQGCGVHQDRPLVCRLYPLGRRVSAGGEETFHELAPHPQTEGVYGVDGTVEDFLVRQGTQPFMEAVERYVDLTGRMAITIQSSINKSGELHDEMNNIIEGVNRQNIMAQDWFDMDRVLARVCAARNIPVPSDLTGKMNLHIQAVEEWGGRP